MSDPTPITVDAAVAALREARGCGCCGFTDALIALAPCSPACAVDEDGDVMHTYGDGCSAVFADGAERLLVALVEQTRRDVLAEVVKAGALASDDAEEFLP